MTDLAPVAVDWDDPTDAEVLADALRRQTSRGRHGIREWPRDEPFRQRETERAQAALNVLDRHRAVVAGAGTAAAGGTPQDRIDSVIEALSDTENHEYYLADEHDAKVSVAWVLRQLKEAAGVHEMVRTPAALNRDQTEALLDQMAAYENGSAS